jgi:replicative DNA helicase
MTDTIYQTNQTKPVVTADVTVTLKEEMAYSDSIQKATIGRLMLTDKIQIQSLLDKLLPEMFSDKLAPVFTYVRKHYTTNLEKPSTDLVCKHSKVNKDVLFECLINSDIASNFEIVECLKKSLAKKILQEIKTEDLVDPSVLDTVKMLEDKIERAKQVINSESQNISGDALMGEFLEQVSEENERISVNTGFELFDEAQIELKTGHLVVIAGSPKSGKTTFGMQLALNILKQKKAVAIFTLEMSKLEMHKKMMACNSDLRPYVINLAHRTDAKSVGYQENFQRYNGKSMLQAFTTALMDYSNLQKFNDTDNLYMYGNETASTIERICASIRKVKNDNPNLQAILIDQLSFVGTQANFFKTHDKYNKIVRDLKLLANQEKVLIILCCQLNRTAIGEKDGIIMPQSIKDASAIEETADTMFLLGISEDELKSQDKISRLTMFNVVSRHHAGGVFPHCLNEKSVFVASQKIVIRPYTKDYNED